MDKLRLIKTFVVIITFMLVFGSLMLLTVIYKKARPAPQRYKEISLEQPMGSTIENMVVIGDNLAILIKNGGEADRIIIYSPNTGQKPLTINL